MHDQRTTASASRSRRPTSTKTARRLTKTENTEPKPKAEVPGGTYVEALEWLCESTGQGRGYAMLPNVLRLIVRYDKAGFLAWLLDRQRRLRRAKKPLGSEYRDYSYCTTDAVKEAWPASFAGKSEAAAKNTVTRMFDSVKEFVSLKPGDEVAELPGVNMPRKHRRFRWYKIRAKKLKRLAEEALKARDAEKAARAEEVEARKQARKSALGRGGSSWGRKYAVVLQRGIQSHDYDETDWAKRLDSLAADKGEGMVADAVEFWSACARHAAGFHDSVRDMFGLPAINDAGHFCVPTVFQWVVDKMKKAEKHGGRLKRSVEVRNPDGTSSYNYVNDGWDTDQCLMSNRSRD